MLPTNRRPTTPGEVLQHEFLDEWQMSQAAFARHIGWPASKLSEVIKGKRGITAKTALVFADATGMPAQFWLNLQQAVDLYDATADHKAIGRLPQAS